MTDLTRKGVTYSEALTEGIARAPIDQASLYAYELWHSGIAEPFRFVNDTTPLSATLESSAPRNPGEEVEFIACPCQFERPEESDSASSPTLRLSRPDVGGLLKNALDQTRGSLEPWQLIERVYTSNDTSRPALNPTLPFELKSVDIAGSAATIEAQFDDDGNMPIPRLTFRRSQYPGLQR